MNVGFRKSFKKQFDKLPKKVQNHFYRKLDIFTSNPFDPVLNNHQLSGRMKNMRSINVTGDIRAIYEPVEKHTALFLSITSHSELYE